MTRSAFLFKLLAAVGIGQAASKTREPSSIQCLSDDGSGLLKWVSCRCADGEERCPLGHCQKPREVHTQVIGSPLPLAVLITSPVRLPDRVSGDQWISPVVCSVCGVVYVPPATASREARRP